VSACITCSGLLYGAGPGLQILADLDAFEEHIQQRLDMVIMALVELNDRLAYCGGESQMAPSIFDA